MSVNMLYSILLTGIGILNLFLATKFLTDPKFAREYIEKSPKAWLWRKMFGVEKALKITKSFFVPLGIAFGIFCILFGVISFFL